jgi:hypothetical protein
VSPAPGGGLVLFTDSIEDGQLLGQGAVDPTSGTASVTVTIQPGLHGIVATFGGFGSYLGSASTGLLVSALSGGTPSQTSLAVSPSTVEAGLEVTVTATVTSGATGTVVFTDGVVFLGNAGIDETSGVATTAVRLIVPGTRQIVATYFGDAIVAGSQSSPVIVVVTPDTAVHAARLGVSLSTFYPVKDGYRDTVDVRGTVLDRARVVITIEAASTHRKVRSVDLGSTSGPYTWAWNGRTNAGTLAPAGRYRVIQTLKDAAGHTLTSSAYTTLSMKRLEWKSDSITRRGDQLSHWNASDFAMVSLVYSGFTHGVYLYGNVLDSWAWVDFDFRLPAAIEYGKLTWAVLGEVPTFSTNDGPATISLWNYAIDEEGEEYLTGAGYGWYSFGTPAKDFVSTSRTVRAFVSVYGANEGVWDVAEVRLTFSYAVLR